MVIYQKPNPLFIAAAAAYLVFWLTKSVNWLGWLSILAYGLSAAAFGYWAYLEITSGVNWFRKALGWVVMLIAIHMAYGFVFY